MGRERRTKKSEEITKSAGRFGLRERERVRTKRKCRITWFGQRGSLFFFGLFPSPRGSVPNLPSSSESNLLILLPLSLHSFTWKPASWPIFDKGTLKIRLDCAIPSLLLRFSALVPEDRAPRGGSLYRETKTPGRQSVVTGPVRGDACVSWQTGHFRFCDWPGPERLVSTCLPAGVGLSTGRQSIGRESLFRLLDLASVSV
ncbi:uncharacterized protein LY79DRAFT_325385 [Colletotrichum navitas]|uniref:Uncharacterized protein n=1 Tax=Colletotrichum navitas TaxID=681940 RepID=A0AAD8V8A3_9PEZI|nr:uncharacterized protein LY79DRAFT_325385 [Colletotrichum navitas]KAK1598007.1 hypothetical protein LY79DRAFT_325385 [Colletotrichum navitas]